MSSARIDTDALNEKKERIMARLFHSVVTGLLIAPGLAIVAQAAPAPQTVWSTMLKVPVYNTPQTRDGQVYLTSTQSSGPNVFAIDGSTGKPLWSFPTQGSIAIPPTVGPTQVFVASDVGNTHFMRAIDAKTGALIWKYTRDQPPECMCSYQSTLSGGLLFAQTDGHSLYAFQPTGSAPSKRLWSFDGDGALLTKPVAADGVVVVGSSDRRVYGLDAKTGKTLWTATTGYGFTADPVVRDGVVVIGDQGGNIDGFDVTSGKQLWNFGASGAIDDAAVTEGKTAYVVSEDHNLYALNIANGQTVWQYGMDDYAEHPPVLVGHLVVVDNRAGQLLGLDAAKGSVAWQTDLGGTPFSAPIPWQGGKAVVLKIGDHAIGAFDSSSGKPIWQYGTKAVVTLPIVTGDRVNVATSTGEVMALD
jgi:outer membrane protein assembly factor BamB